MSISENRYVLKQITKSSEEDFINAIHIYLNETPKEIRTNTNEIASWLDKKNGTTPFDMLIFVLYLDDVLIGFSQVTYIQSQQIAILDYISLKQPYRLNSVFLVFLNMIQSHLMSSTFQVTYYIAEISNKGNGMYIDRESAFYKKVICLEGFGKVANIYYNFPLGIDNYESEFESLMYIKTNDHIAFISKETFLTIVHAICYEYYYVWYSDFLTSEEIELYKRKLDKYYNSICRAADGSSIIKIEYANCPLFFSPSNNNTSGIVPAKMKTHGSSIILLVVTVIVIPIPLTAIYKYIFIRLGIEFESISTFISSITGTIITAIVAYKTYRK